MIQSGFAPSYGYALVPDDEPAPLRIQPRPQQQQHRLVRCQAAEFTEPAVTGAAASSLTFATQMLGQRSAAPGAAPAARREPVKLEFVGTGDLRAHLVDRLQRPGGLGAQQAQRTRSQGQQRLPRSPQRQPHPQPPLQHQRKAALDHQHDLWQCSDAAAQTAGVYLPHRRHSTATKTATACGPPPARALALNFDPHAEPHQGGLDLPLEHMWQPQSQFRSPGRYYDCDFPSQRPAADVVAAAARFRAGVGAPSGHNDSDKAVHMLFTPDARRAIDLVPRDGRPAGAVPGMAGPAPCHGHAGRFEDDVREGEEEGEEEGAPAVSMGRGWRQLHRGCLDLFPPQISRPQLQSLPAQRFGATARDGAVPLPPGSYSCRQQLGQQDQQRPLQQPQCSQSQPQLQPPPPQPQQAQLAVLREQLLMKLLVHSAKHQQSQYHLLQQLEHLQQLEQLQKLQHIQKLQQQQQQQHQMLQQPEEHSPPPSPPPHLQEAAAAPAPARPTAPFQQQQQRLPKEMGQDGPRRAKLAAMRVQAQLHQQAVEVHEHAAPALAAQGEAQRLLFPGADQALSGARKLPKPPQQQRQRYTPAATAAAPACRSGPLRPVTAAERSSTLPPRASSSDTSAPTTPEAGAPSLQAPAGVAEDAAAAVHHRSFHRRSVSTLQGRGPQPGPQPGPAAVRGPGQFGAATLRVPAEQASTHRPPRNTTNLFASVHSPTAMYPTGTLETAETGEAALPPAAAAAAPRAAPPAAAVAAMMVTSATGSATEPQRGDPRIASSGGAPAGLRPTVPSASADGNNSLEAESDMGPAADAVDADAVDAAGDAELRRVLIAKALTASDARTRRMILPRGALEAAVPHLAAPDRPSHSFDVTDAAGRTWHFVIRSWQNGPNPKPVYVLEHVSEFMKAYGISTGDVLGLLRCPDGSVRVEVNTPAVVAAAGAASARSRIPALVSAPGSTPSLQTPPLTRFETRLARLHTQQQLQKQQQEQREAEDVGGAARSNNSGRGGVKRKRVARQNAQPSSDSPGGPMGGDPDKWRQTTEAEAEEAGPGMAHRVRRALGF